MTFECTGGPFAETAGGECEAVFKAPPGPGWTWHGGENDGKLHGPLRIRGVFLEKGDKADAGQLELIDIRVKSECAPERACVLVAERRDGSYGSWYVATVRNLSPRQADATLSWTVRDWAGKKIEEGTEKMLLPAGAEPVEKTVLVSARSGRFAEAEFTLDAPGQAIPPEQAYHVAPLEEKGAADLAPESPFGMGVYLYRYGGHPEGLAEMDRAAQLAQDAGVKWSREEFGWGRAEPQPGRFDWTFYDNVVAAAKRHGISIYGLLSYWPGWAKAYTPEGIEGYSRFAAAAAERYRNDIRHWEVWNEPNIFFWQGPKDMYADLLKQAYAAIKKANPEALVLGCSTAGIDSKFIRRTMELGGPFDILTIHPYRSHLDDAGFIKDLQNVADLAKRPDGRLRPAWITEMGWATYAAHNGQPQDFQATTQRDQACLLARAYIDAIASGAAPNISWYDFRNDGTDPFNFEHNMGVVTRDFRPKPAYRAFAITARLLKGMRVEKRMDLGKDIIAYQFADAAGTRTLSVMWSVNEAATAAIPGEKPLTVTDLMGGSETLSPTGGKVNVALRPGVPVFVAAAP
jgi:GH35 family endo-1,4-beta-xylanase